MNRRSLLMGMAAAPALMALGTRASGAESATRRVRPTDPAWPRRAQWEALRDRVGGALVRPTPLGDCQAQPNGAPCADFLKNRGNPYFIGDQAGGTQVSGWLDAWTPQPSAYAVAARTTRDVVEAVNFARTHNLRLVVKGGGHSYQGTSNSPDSLLVWTRAMRAINLHDAFVPDGRRGRQAPVPAVTVEAGAVWMDVYDAVTTRAGRYVQGGGCSTVGVAGLIQSGGFGSFSKRYGLAAASLLQAEIVTADGRVRTVNARQDPDLFWALKGGGGGSLGVVTRLTLQTHDLPDVFGSVSATIQATDEAAFQRLIGRFLAFYRGSLCNPHWGESISVRGDNSLSISMVRQGVDTAQAREVWAPFFAWVAASPKDFKLRGPGYGGGAARDWWAAASRRERGSNSEIFDRRPGAAAHHAWWAGDQDQVGAFVHGYDSLWLPASLLADGERDALAEALVAASRFMQVDLQFNKGLAGAPAEAVAAARDTATNPCVLTAFALAIVATGGPALYPGQPGAAADPAEARRNAAGVAAAAAILRRVAPGAGSYLSESDYFNRAWQDAYWGSNYPRLLSVKAKYDPTGLFIVHHGVGSEGWSSDGFTRLAAPRRRLTAELHHA